MAASSATPAPVMPAADDQHVERLRGQGGEGVGAGDHRAAWTGRCGRRRPARAPAPASGPWRARGARGRGSRSSAGDAARLAALRGAQHRRRAPVAAEPARVRAEQQDERRARGGGVVLLVGLRVLALLHDRGGDQRRRAVELRRRLRTCGRLERGQRLRAEHPEAPRVREVVVGRPAGQLEELLERLPVDRARARRPCAFGACGSARRAPRAGRLTRRGYRFWPRWTIRVTA